MKKKILLIIIMFMLITNVKALTFNVDVTNAVNTGNFYIVVNEPYSLYKYMYLAGITEEALDILSIINGDDAFEIKEGETFPTLKVFNE